MIISKYNFFFKSKLNKFLVYNSLTNSFIELDEDTFKFLSSNNSDVNEILDTEIGQTLIKQKVIVANNYDDINEITLLYTLARLNSKILDLTIAPTYDCNFDCTYCYEESRPEIYMSDETIDKLLEFIESFGDIALNITWYGGEPLMALDQIDSICEKLKKKGIKFKHSIVTNGSLINEKTIEFFKKYNLQRAQITIDGPQKIHDARRFYKGQKGSFNNILNNIDNLLNKFPSFVIDLRINIDKNNAQYFFETCEQIKKRYIGHKINVYAGFVDEVSECPTKNTCIFDRSDVRNFKLDVYKNYKMDLGVYPSFKRQSCIAKRLNGYVIGADGNVFKCWNDIGIVTKAVSSLYSQKILNKKTLYRYLNGNDNSNDLKCKNCILFPICDGGCQYLRIDKMVNNSKIDVCHLAKDNIQEILETYYEQNYIN